MTDNNMGGKPRSANPPEATEEASLAARICLNSDGLLATGDGVLPIYSGFPGLRQRVDAVFDQVAQSIDESAVAGESWEGANLRFAASCATAAWHLSRAVHLNASDEDTRVHGSFAVQVLALPRAFYSGTLAEELKKPDPYFADWSIPSGQVALPLGGSWQLTPPAVLTRDLVLISEATLKFSTDLMNHPDFPEKRAGDLGLARAFLVAAVRRLLVAAHPENKMAGSTILPSQEELLNSWKPDARRHQWVKGGGKCPAEVTDPLARVLSWSDRLHRVCGHDPKPMKWEVD